MSPAEVDLVSGTVDMMFGSVSTAIPLVQSGKLKALAVTGRERMKAMPDLPTIEEGGLKGYDVEAVYFLAAPARIPQPVLKTLTEAVAQINREPDVREFMDRIYARPLTGGGRGQGLPGGGRAQVAGRGAGHRTDRELSAAGPQEKHRRLHHERIQTRRAGAAGRPDGRPCAYRHPPGRPATSRCG